MFEKARETKGEPMGAPGVARKPRDHAVIISKPEEPKVGHDPTRMTRRETIVASLPLYGLAIVTALGVFKPLRPPIAILVIGLQVALSALLFSAWLPRHLK